MLHQLTDKIVSPALQRFLVVGSYPRVLKTIDNYYQWGMQARAGRVTKVGKVSGKQMGFS
jgi:hypothetical protein